MGYKDNFIKPQSDGISPDILRELEPHFKDGDVLHDGPFPEDGSELSGAKARSVLVRSTEFFD